MDRPWFLDGTALLFVFDTQLLEGTLITNGGLLSGGPVIIDRTGAGQQPTRMPLEMQVVSVRSEDAVGERSYCRWV